MSMPRDSHRAADGYVKARQERMAGERIQRQLSDERWAELAEQKRPIVIDRRAARPNSIGVPRGVALGAFGSLVLAALTVAVLAWYSPLGVIAICVCLGSAIAVAAIGSACLPADYADEDDMPEGAM